MLFDAIFKLYKFGGNFYNIVLALTFDILLLSNFIYFIYVIYSIPYANAFMYESPNFKLL